MFNSVPSHMETPIPTLLSASVSNSRSNSLEEAIASSKQDVNLALPELNVVEMSKAEYTQLQQVLFLQVDPESNKGVVEAKGGSTFYPVGSSSDVSQCHPVTITSGVPSSSSECQNVHPIICHSVVTPASKLSTGQPLKHLEFQEMRMMKLSASNLYVTSRNSANKAPNETGGNSSGAGIVQVKKAGSTTGINVLKRNSAQPFDSRWKSAVRVRLEDRFNSIQSEGSRGHEAQSPLKNLVPFIHQPSHQMESQYNTCTTLVKNEGSANTGTLQFPHPCNSLSSTIGSSHTQMSASESYGCSSPLQEELKLQEMSLPKNFSFCYKHEWKSAKQNKPMPKQMWNKGEDYLVKEAYKETSQSPQGQVEIQNLRDRQTVPATNEMPWSPTQYNTCEPAPSNSSTVPSPRREKKNRMERDRRRKIRMCCDKLNVLVPFCNMGMDKATTLHWTVAFLKYIQNQHGDSLKEEFERSYEKQKGNEKT